MWKFSLCCSILQVVSSMQAKPVDNRLPNILFCVADDQSFPHAGAYGCKWVKAPSFDRIAKDGILFTNAFTPNAKCAPSRSCILTGRTSWQLEAAANHTPFFPEKFKTFSEVLIENGYHVGHTAKGWAPGDPGNRNGKKRELLGPAFNDNKNMPPAKFISDNDYSANFEAFLNADKEEKPFCFWYGSMEPHRPYEFKAGKEKGGKHDLDIDKVFGFWPDNDTVRNDLLDYAFEIEYFDYHLSKMLKILEQKGMLENTIIIVTSDNGMPFPRIKGRERNDVGQPDDQGYPIRGIISDKFLYLRNFNPERWPTGNPETGYMDCDGSPTKSIILNDRRLKGESGYWDLNFGKHPLEELYQISTDQECMENLTENAKYDAVKRKLIRLMEHKLFEDKDPRAMGSGAIFDTYPYSVDQIRNFYNRFMSGEKMNASWINQTDIEKIVTE